MNVLVNLLLVSCCSTAGVVCGFCLGGLVGSALGPRALGDDLFLMLAGALVGALAGFVLGIVGALRWQRAAKLKASGGAAAVALLAAGATWAFVQAFGW